MNRVCKILRSLLRSGIRVPGNIKARARGVMLGSGSSFSWGAKVIRSKRSEIIFGNNCKILFGAIIAPHPDGSIVFGDNCSINPYCMIYGHGGLKVGNNVRIAAHTTIIPANHQYDYWEGQMTHSNLRRAGIVIEDNVWIGTGVRILDGVRITSNTIVGAGAVVTRSIEIPGVYGGVPARFIRSNGP